jgi:hypothetical protein
LLLVIFGCNQFEEIDSSLEEQVFKVSEENGFRSEKIPLNQIPTEKGIHLKLNELPEFLKYLKKGRSDKAALDFNSVSNIFSRNQINVNSFPSESAILNPEISSLIQSRIQCFQNAYLVNMRVPAMTLPGPDLNGALITMGIGGGNLNTSSITMYGFYPFMGIVGTNINADITPSSTNNYTYGFQVQYTIAFTLFIDGTAFLNYDTVNLRVRIDGCSGEVSYHEVNE